MVMSQVPQFPTLTDSLSITDAASNQTLRGYAGDLSWVCLIRLASNTTITNLFQKDDGATQQGSEYLAAYEDSVDSFSALNAFQWQMQESVSPWTTHGVQDSFNQSPAVPAYYAVWGEYNDTAKTLRINSNNGRITSASSVANHVNATTTAFTVGGITSGQPASRVCMLDWFRRKITPYERYLFNGMSTFANGTMQSGATWVTDAPAGLTGQTKCISNDGTALAGSKLAQAVKLPNDGWSISIWFKTTAAVPGAGDLTLLGNTTNANVGLFFPSNTTLLVSNNTGVTQRTYTIPTFNDGAWHNIIVTMDGANSCNVYFDNAVSSSGAQTIDNDQMSIDEVGRYSDGSAGINFNGKLCALQMFMDVISSGDRTALQTGAATAILPACKILMNEGTGTTNTDTGNGSGTPVGMWYNQIPQSLKTESLSTYVSRWDLVGVASGVATWIDSRNNKNHLTASSGVQTGDGPKNVDFMPWAHRIRPYQMHDMEEYLAMAEY